MFKQRAYLRAEVLGFLLFLVGSLFFLALLRPGIGNSQVVPGAGFCSSGSADYQQGCNLLQNTCQANSTGNAAGTPIREFGYVTADITPRSPGDTVVIVLSAQLKVCPGNARTDNANKKYDELYTPANGNDKLEGLSVNLYNFRSSSLGSCTDIGWSSSTDTTLKTQGDTYTYEGPPNLPDSPARYHSSAVSTVTITIPIPSGTPAGCVRIDYNTRACLDRTLYDSPGQNRVIVQSCTNNVGAGFNPQSITIPIQASSSTCPGDSDNGRAGQTVPSGQSVELYCYNHCPSGTRYPIPGDPNSCNNTPTCSTNPAYCPPPKQGTIESYCNSDTYGSVPDVFVGDAKIRFARVSDGSTFTESIEPVNSSGGWGVAGGTPISVKLSTEQLYVEAYERGDATGYDALLNYDYKVASDGVKLYLNGPYAACATPPVREVCPPGTTFAGTSPYPTPGDINSCDYNGKLCPAGTTYEGKPYPVPGDVSSCNATFGSGGVVFSCTDGITATPNPSPSFSWYFAQTGDGGEIDVFQQTSGNPPDGAGRVTAWAPLYTSTGFSNWQGYKNPLDVPDLRDGKRYVAVVFSRAWAGFHEYLPGITPSVPFSDGTYWDATWGQTAKLEGYKTQFDFTCPASNYYDLTPTTNGPPDTSTKNGSGQTLVNISHTIKNACGASNGPTTGTIDVTISLTIRNVNGAANNTAPNQPSGGTLRVLGVCGDSGSDYVYNGINVGKLNKNQIVCTFITVNPYTNQPGLGGPKSSPEQCSDGIGSKPYFKVWGGDIVVGDTGGCRPGSYTIEPKPYLKGNAADFGGGDHRGSSTDQAIFALGDVEGVYSGSRVGIALPYLTFSNTDPAKQYGGNFGDRSEVSNCIEDQYPAVIGIPEFSGSRPPGNTTIYRVTDTTSTSINLNSYNGYQLVYWFRPPGGKLTITGGTTGTNIYVEGTAIVDGNMTASLLAASNDLVYTSNVAYVNNFYASATDHFDTCVRPDGSNYTNAELADACDKQLNFYGHVRAGKVKLNRTFGDLADAPPNETVTNGLAAPLKQAAENFKSSVNYYLGPLQIGGIDTITGLAPIF